MKIEKDDTNYVKSEGMILVLLPQQSYTTNEKVWSYYLAKCDQVLNLSAKESRDLLSLTKWIVSRCRNCFHYVTAVDAIPVFATF